MRSQTGAMVAAADDEGGGEEATIFSTLFFSDLSADRLKVVVKGLMLRIR